MRKRYLVGALAGAGLLATAGVVGTVWYVAWVRSFDWQDDSFLNDESPGGWRWRDRNKQAR